MGNIFFEFPTLFFKIAYSSYDHHQPSYGHKHSHHTTVKLKIDPVDLLTIAAFLAAAVFLINEILVLLMLMRKKRRKKRSPNEIPHCDFMLRGKFIDDLTKISFKMLH